MPPGILVDAEIVATDGLAPYTRFDGSGGSIQTTSGWTRQEQASSNGTMVAVSSAVDARSSFLFLAPGGSALDLQLRCSPSDGMGAGPKAVQVFRGEIELARAEMHDGWNELRIPLPDRSLVPGLNELSLRFAGSERAAGDVAPPRKDRKRWARCSEIAVLPRAADGVRQVAEPPAHSGGESGARSVELAGTRTLSIPLPASSEVTVFPQLDSDAEGAALDLHVVEREAEHLLHWKPGATAFSFSTTERPSALRFSARTAPAPGLRDTAVTLSLTPKSLEIASTRRSSAPRRPPHVFVYLVDTVRADAVGSTWQGLPAAPSLAAFRRESVTFARARTASSWTLPSVVSILSGVYPFRHGIMKGDTRFTDSRVPSLAEILATAGYQTVGISQSWVASASFGVDRGFSRFVLSEQLNGTALRSQDLRKAFRLWYLGESAGERPIFAYLHGVDPHMPYTPPPGRYREAATRFAGSLPEEAYLPKSLETRALASQAGEVRHLQALYQGEVLYADEQFGRFLDLLRLLNLYDDALVVFVADHGEEFAEHGSFGHGRTLFEEQLLVPLVVKFPRSKWAGRVVDADVSTVDLVPTILEAAGVSAAPLVLDGLPLTAAITGAPGTPREVFSEVNPAANASSPEVDWAALIVGPTKCLHSANRVDNLGREVPEWTYLQLGPELYEERLLAGDAAAARDCQRRLARWLVEAKRARTESTQDSVGQEELEKLRALGYIR